MAIAIVLCHFHGCHSLTRTILLVRHGQTDWNIEKRFQGHQDIPLNALGLAQARAVGHFLRDHAITHIYTSDLSRARSTAYQIWLHHRSVPFHEMPLLREGFGGELEGRIFSKQIGHSEIQSLNSLRSILLHTGETLAEIHNRIMSAFEYITTSIADNSIAVMVSHGGPIRLLLGTLQGISMKESIVMKINNGSISKIQSINGQWTSTSQNYKNHLLA